MDSIHKETFPNLRKLQLAELSILEEFIDVCSKNHLIYYIDGGALIGSIRNQGFIPWDDDIDICMPRSDFNKLVILCNNQNTMSFYMDHYTSPNFKSGSFAIKLCSKDVKYIKVIGEKELLFDASISIFPIDGAPKTSINRVIFEKRVGFLYLILRMTRSSYNGVEDIHHSLLENIGIWINNILNTKRWLSIKEITKRLDSLLSKYPYDNSDMLCTYSFGRNPFYFKRDIFGKPNELSFEGLKIYVPRDYDTYLRICYGDYMKLPPEDERIPKHVFKIIEK